MLPQEIIDNPRVIGIPHDTWRPSQLDAYQKTLDLSERGGGFIFHELPTGVGKSVLATALAHHDKVLVLVQTLGLLEQYEREYGFTIIKGRQEYPCALEPKIRAWKHAHMPAPTARDCHLKNMYKCSAAKECPYMQARMEISGAKKAACTYKYALLSDDMMNRDGFLVMDEAHISADEILSFSEFVLRGEQLKQFKLPDFPILSYGDGGDGALISDPIRQLLINWLGECLSAVGVQEGLFDYASTEFSAKKTFGDYIQLGIELLTESDQLFLMVGKPKSGGMWWEREATYLEKDTYLVIKPLSVDMIAKRLWSNKHTTVLMSATIGDPSPLAKELGIDIYENYTYPHPIPKMARPIYNLGMERMTHANLDKNPSLYQLQSIVIWNFIKSLDPTWRGIVLTTSYAKVKKLRQFLYDRMPRRIMMPKSTRGVTARISEFIDDKRQGLIAVDTIQGWGTGLDLRGDTARFSIIAGVPYVNPSDKYDMARVSRDGGRKYAMWRSANSIVQASGRVSRGELEDDNDFMLNISAFADGSCTSPSIMSFYPKWYKEAIIEM